MPPLDQSWHRAARQPSQRQQAGPSGSTTNPCWNIESTVTYWLGGLVVKRRPLEWGSPKVESWSGHLSHLQE